ncbi:ATP-binding cassette domain-containing protein [Marispirochaeta sp.]|uniref:ATP-binding cassette domain-containing protein n=1 Tax=Marispirochaeta sp. TaxID=2038653 RepID=UPI0029C846FB|nr:ATP-binding cassette domain-containing protein [Marispirochaeta sp.]
MIELRGISYTYPGSASPAVSKLNVSFRPGEVTVIAGSNGSGKSTLTRLILGLLIPDEGTIEVDSDREIENRRGLIGLVRQDPRNQLIASLVDEEVAFGPENLSLPREEIQKRVQESLLRVGLAGFDGRNPDTLSAGQQQRLAIAGILAMRPKYVIFDEASSMLDPAGREDFYRLCAELAAVGVGVLSISHFPDEALRADRMLVMEKGALSAQGAPAAVFRRMPQLESPFLLKLSDALAARGIPLNEELKSIEELIRKLTSFFTQPGEQT